MVDNARGRRAAPEASTEEGSVPKSQRRRRAGLSGLKFKLDANQRPGFVRRWVNGDEGRIMQMQELGYDFVTTDERTDGQGTRVSRYVGKDGDGKPVQAYLMETPKEEYEVGVAEKEEQLKPFEQALRAGRDTTGRLTEDTYQPSDKSSISHSR